MYYLVRHFQPEQVSPTHQPPSLKSLISILTLQAFVSNLNPHPHPPSLISTLTLHLSDLKPSPSPSISNLNFTLSDLNPRPSSLHLRSHPHLHLRSYPSPSKPPSLISTLTLTLHLSDLKPSHPTIIAQAKSMSTLSLSLSLSEIRKS